MSTIKIKPSLLPFTWRGVIVILLAVLLFIADNVFSYSLPLQLEHFAYLVNYAALGLFVVGLLVLLIGVARRNAYTYLITDTDIVVQKQLFSRNVRRIPLSSVSDVEVSQSFIGRLLGYGNLAPVTKSGYGLVRGMDRAENLTSEMTYVPKPDKVAELIMSRISVTSKMPTNA